MHKTIILLGVLHVCETWSLTFKDGSRLRVMSRIFGSKLKEVIGSWIKIRKEEFKIVAFQQILLEGSHQCGCNGRGCHTTLVIKHSYKILVKKCKRKRPFGRISVYLKLCLKIR